MEEKNTEEKKKNVCVKCKEEKNEDEGTFMLEGSAFACNECVKKDEEKKGDNVCEFC